ncbi:MAG: hypothetical protein KDI19_10490 [Pseudomonadales bacterium]|nr:hypothetical protein [Pseudomonadales bacterium]
MKEIARVVLVFGLVYSFQAVAAGFGNVEPATGGGFGNSVSTWHSQYGKASFSIAEGVIRSKSGGYVTVGSIGRDAAMQFAGVADRQIQVSKLDSGGAYLWSKTYTPFGVKLRGIAKQVKEDDKGNLLVIGDLGKYGSKDRPETRDVFVMKLDANGEKLWARKYGGPEANTAGDIALDPDGGYLVLAEKDKEKAAHAWLFKLSADGDFVGESLFPKYRLNYMVSVDDGYLLTGPGILKVDRAGREVWYKSGYPGFVTQLCPDGDGFIVGGNAIQGKLYPAWVGRIDQKGDLSWSHVYQFRKQKVSTVTALAVQDGAIYAGGSQQVSYSEYNIGYVMKLTPKGEPVWRKLVTGTKLGSRFTQMATTSDNGIIVSGVTNEDIRYTNGKTLVTGQALVVKFDPDGATDIFKDDPLRNISVQ